MDVLAIVSIVGFISLLLKMYFHYRLIQMISSPLHDNKGFLRFLYWLVFEDYTLKKVPELFNFVLPIPRLPLISDTDNNELKKLNTYVMALSIIALIALLSVHFINEARYIY